MSKKTPFYTNYQHKMRPTHFVGSTLVTNKRSLTWDEVRGATPVLKDLYEYLNKPLFDGSRQPFIKRGGK